MTEAGLRTESAITKHHLEEAAHKVTPAVDKSKTPHHPNRRVKDRPPPGPFSAKTCLWCGRAPHANRRDCPASNDTCHGCGKRSHWKQVCWATSIYLVSESAQMQKLTRKLTTLSLMRFTRCNLQPKESMSISTSGSTSSSPKSKSFRFQVDSGCSCNTIHVNDLNQLPPIQIKPSMVRLLDYSKSIIPTRGQVTLHCTRHGMSYAIVAQVITSQQYYAPLLGLADSTRMGIRKYDVDTANTLLMAPVLPLPPPGELTFDYIRSAYANLFEGLGELDEPFSLTLNPDIRPIHIKLTVNICLYRFS